MPFIILQNPGLTLGEKPSSHQIAGISLIDKNGYGVDSRVGLIETRVEANENYTRTRLGAYRNSVENHDYYEVAVIVPEESDGYALAPTPKADATGNEIATVKWIRENIGTGRSVSWDSQINVGNLSANQVYTAPANGYILGYSANDGNASVLIKINEKEAGYAGNISSFIVPVTKGDKFVCTSEIGVKKVKFIPCK